MPIRLLVVDDSKLVREMVMDAVASCAELTVVAEAGSGVEAVALFRQHRPDVVLLDVIMPDIDGIETLRNIVKIDSAANVVMLSSSGQDGLVVEAIMQGARMFLAKPFEPETLVEAVLAAGRPKPSS